MSIQDTHTQKEKINQFIKIILWYILIYTILRLLERAFYLKRKAIDDFIAYPYRGNRNEEL